MSNNDGLHGDDLTRATTGFNAAISVWKLSSQQIYSRFNARKKINQINPDIIQIFGLESPFIRIINIVEIGHHIQFGFGNKLIAE